MNRSKHCILLLALMVSACTRQQEQLPPSTFAPKVVEAKGYVVPRDSLAEPKMVPVGKPKVVKVGNPKVVPIKTNIHPTGKPKVVKVGNPRVCIPGQDGFLLPKTVSAIDSPYVAGIPDVVIARDPSNKESNPQNFSYFSNLQGLSNFLVHCILEDRSGNLWFGTIGGAVKFDGINFTCYSQIQGLGSPQVNFIYQDNKGNIWFATESGVTRLSSDGKKFTRFTEKEGLFNDIMTWILEDKNGNLWFSTQGDGVFRLNRGGKSFTHFTMKEGLSSDVVICIFEDKNGNLWFGTDRGGVSRLSQDGKSFTHYTVKEGLSNNSVTGISEDRNGNLWFATWCGGASRLSRDGKTFTVYTRKEGLCSDTVKNILEDKSGNLWFSNWGSGVSRLSRDGKSFTYFTEKEGLSSNQIEYMLEDKNGQLWFATISGGVSKYNGELFTHFTTREGLSHNSVFSILEDKSGNLWFGTIGGGVSRLDRDGRTFTHFTEKEGLCYNEVWKILEDKDGNTWFCTWGFGVSRLDRNGRTFTHYTEREGLCNNNVRSMLQDKNGNFWFSTIGRSVSGGEGVSRLSRDGKTFTNYTAKEGLGSNSIWSMLEDQSGNIWFGTYDRGVTRLSPDGRTFTHYTEREGLCNNNVRSMLQDKNGNLWIGTENGVSRLSNDGIIFTQFTVKEGLSGNNISGIMEDKSGNLWFGTSSGISKLPFSAIAGKSNNLFKNYTYEDGFLGIGVMPGAMFEDRNGTIWFGTYDRLTAYHPEGDMTDTIAPNIQLTNLELFNEDIPWNICKKKKDTILVLGNGVKVGNFHFDSLSAWYFLPENLSLAYNNNFLTFRYIGITQKQSKKVKYLYKLEGFDENWSALTSRTDAPYGNLPHGAYTFKVKAMNNDGYWSNELSYTFSIRPPWYKTAWFRLLTVLFILLSLFLLHHWRTASLRRRQKQLEKTVEERTAEVVHQKEEIEVQKEEVECQKEELEVTLDKLKQTQSQLIQSEKMASLGMLTAGIAHEINNPVNFINSGAISLQKDYEDLQQIIQSIEKLPPETQSLADRLGMYELLKNIPQTIEDIKTGVHRTSEIVKGLRNFTRMDTSELKEADIHEGIDSTLLLLSHKIKDRIHIVKDYDDHIGSIKCYPGPLNQVFMNLLNNAIDAIEQKIKEDSTGGIPSDKPISNYHFQIGITTKLIEEGIKKQVKIVFSDNGIGIPDEIKDKLFDPFFTTKEVGKGTGLGLSICHGIIEKHGGTITFESKVKEGAAFTIILPGNI